ncbi:MAG: hypothetical protein RLZZ232_2867, partial [Planctomycetota bacterium]
MVSCCDMFGRHQDDNIGIKRELLQFRESGVVRRRFCNWDCNCADIACNCSSERPSKLKLVLTGTSAIRCRARINRLSP